MLWHQTQNGAGGGDASLSNFLGNLVYRCTSPTDVPGFSDARRARCLPQQGTPVPDPIPIRFSLPDTKNLRFIFCAGRENRTPVSILARSCSTTKPCPHIYFSTSAKNSFSSSASHTNTFSFKNLLDTPATAVPYANFFTLLRLGIIIVF